MPARATAAPVAAERALRASTAHAATIEDCAWRPAAAGGSPSGSYHHGVRRHAPAPAVALATLLATALLGAGCGDDAEGEALASYDQQGAPFRFSYPPAFTTQAENTGPEVKGRAPVHKVAVGRDETNVVVVAAYRLRKPVEEFAPSDFAAVLDRAATTLARARKVRIARRATGKLGDLSSTVYELTPTAGGIEQRLVYAFRGTTQFFVRCQWDAAGKAFVRAGCDEVQRTFRPS